MRIIKLYLKKKSFFTLDSLIFFIFFYLKTLFISKSHLSVIKKKTLNHKNYLLLQALFK